MTIRNLVAVAGVVAATALAGCATTGSESASAVEPIVGPIREGRCHMNGCSWFQVQSFDLVRETERGALLRVVMREGSSMHPNGNYPRRPRASSIQWAPESQTAYFMCSTRYPAIVFEGEAGGWTGYRLDLTQSAGATTFIHNQYRAICHTDGALDAEGAAARLGYTRYDGEMEISVARPEELFDRVN